MKNQNYWIEKYQKKGALWIHPGGKAPHAELTSGKHSNGFFNSRLIIEDDELLNEAVHGLVQQLLFHHSTDLNKVQVVVGPQTGATKMAEFMAKIISQMSEISNNVCEPVSPAKGNDAAGEKIMVLDDTQAEKVRGKVVLLCEDVITTSKSVELSAKAVTEAGAYVLPYVLVLVNRSGKTHAGEKEDKKIIALIDHPMLMWDPQKCPLCADSSRVVKKPKDNWASLHEAV